jgi:uncharacterized SAM-binding protein YcdF (DUF218 family)
VAICCVEPHVPTHPDWDGRELKRLVRTLVHFLTALGLLVLMVTVTPLTLWWSARLAGPWNDPKGDVLIVAGGSTLGDGMIGSSSYWRAIHGARSFRQGSFREVVVTGGGEPVSIAGQIADYLVSQGVPRERIRLETRSHTTRENAVNVTGLLAGHPGRKVLLTSDYHMYRAYRAFRKGGLEVEPSPFPDAGKRGSSWQGRWRAFLDLVEESAKILYYRLRGWI